MEPITENNAPQTGPGRIYLYHSTMKQWVSVKAAVPNIGDNPSEQTNDSENSQVNAPSTELNEEEVVSTPNEEPVNEEPIEEETIQQFLTGKHPTWSKWCWSTLPFVMDIQSGVSTENTNIENSYFTDSEVKTLPE